MPTLCVSPDFSRLAAGCERALRWRFDSAGGALLGAVGGLLAGTVLVRTGYAVVRAGISAARARGRQREHLAVLGRYDPRLGATVVDHHAPAAYCLPGRGGRVVITTAALDALDGEQLRAVLAHERAHLRERHELVLAAAAALTRALPHVRAMAVAREQIALLVEMVADDVASAQADRLTVADALLTLASSPAPVAALGAAGTTSAVRIRRLIAAEPVGG
ncbi:MAG TPA: M56 family metallopeptidase [Actinocrinis sp.]|nr:M56 family metallopeptidase [Actinocrinis sp.]